MSNASALLRKSLEIAESEEFERFKLNAADFLSARDGGESVETRLAQMTASLEGVAELVNRSLPPSATKDRSAGSNVNLISPVVVPTSRRFLWLLPVVLGAVVGLVGLGLTSLVDNAFGLTNVALTFFGPHFWLLLLAYAGYRTWRESYVMVPDGCQALITRFGKLETVAEAGRVQLLNPWKKVAYIVNTTREYPYNAPVREAPTAERVNASVDLFLQFRIENPVEFIFTLGGVNGFAEKLENAISEVTRALIYEQKAEAIYDLVGESTQSLLDNLNRQFLPAVRFVNANITHAEPSSQEYRMDLAASEMVRVAKEAYTYQYQLQLRKEQDEGDLTKELAGLRQTLSEIKADIAIFQAQMDTAHEREVNRANTYASQLLIEAESEAKANAALLEAQALDIRALSSAGSPEILNHRFQQEVLKRLESLAERLPQMVNVGPAAESHVNVLSIARQMLGVNDTRLYSEEELSQLRGRMGEIAARIKERSSQIAKLMAADEAQNGAVVPGSTSDGTATQSSTNGGGA